MGTVITLKPFLRTFRVCFIGKYYNRSFAKIEDRKLNNLIIVSLLNCFIAELIKKRWRDLKGSRQRAVVRTCETRRALAERKNELARLTGEDRKIGTGPRTYIFSGALTPSKSRVFLSVICVALSKASRAWLSLGDIFCEAAFDADIT